MEADPINRIRSFNRAVSKRIGALNESFLDRGRPLGEARLLYEIGHGGADVRDLRARLELDSGYVSRLLRSLEKQGLVVGQASANDGRVRRFKLTRKGEREVAELDSRSNEFAHSVLAPLGSSQQARLLTAMAEVERLMQASAVEFAIEPPDSADARYCLHAFYEELTGRFENGYERTKSRPVDTEELVPPAGALVVARLDGKPIGCGMLRGRDGEIGEIKHLWIDDSLRGLGVGRQLLAKLESLAREFGLVTVRLDTNKALTEAQALYRSSGYREVAPFNDEFYAHHWFEKRL